MRKMNQILKEKMESGKLIFGTLATSGLPMLTEMLAQCGFDVLWLDMEHTAIGTESVVNNMIAARSGGTPAWVRVPWNDPVRVKPVVDMGADGIIFPYVRTVGDARLAVASCTYPPEGIRGYGPLRASDYGRISQTEYVTKTYRDCQRILQIEHIDAVKNLQQIAEVEGIDGFIVGPNDLAGSVGKLGQLRCPEMMELYRQIGEIISKTGKPLGIYAGGFNADYIQEWIDMGYTMFFSGSDCAFAAKGAYQLLDQFRNAFGKEE